MAVFDAPHPHDVCGDCTRNNVTFHAFLSPDAHLFSVFAVMKEFVHGSFASAPNVLLFLRECADPSGLSETHSYATIVMPSKSNGVVRIRKPSTADSAQKEIYKLLHIDLKSLPITKTVSSI